MLSHLQRIKNVCSGLASGGAPLEAIRNPAREAVPADLTG